MAHGALKGGPATAAIATTGVAGPESIEGIAPGTVCFAWLFAVDDHCASFTRTHHFEGDRLDVQIAASL